MEIQKVNDLLQSIALDHSEKKPAEAIQKIALALMHMAESLHKTELRVELLQKAAGEKARS